MKDKYRKTLLFISLCIVVLIIVDLVFNFRGIFMENYDQFIKSQENFYDGTLKVVDIGEIDSQKLSDLNITGIMNKKTGKLIAVDVINNSGETGMHLGEFKNNGPFTEVQIKFNDQALTVDKSGNTTLSMSNAQADAQLFELILVKDNVVFDTIIPDEGKNLGKDIDTDNYPFYILRSKVSQNGQKKRCLYYDGGNLYFGIIANYDAIKFDISYDNIDIRSVPLYNSSRIMSALNDNFRINVDSDNTSENLGFSTDKIKINLNLGDNLDKILNSFSDNSLEEFVNYKKKENFTNNEETRSDYFKNDKKQEYCNKNYVKRTTLASVCPGCTGLDDYNIN